MGCKRGDIALPISADIFIFGDFRLDWRGGGLFRCNDGGEQVPVGIGSRALNVLRVLLERAGDLVPKDDIIAAVWPDVVVAEANLAVQISVLRRTLDAVGSVSCIQTMSGRGYRFTAPVQHLPAHPAPPHPHIAIPGQRPPPSVMVASLSNLGVPKRFAHLVNGIAEDISTDLSHQQGVRVVCAPQSLRRNGTSLNPRDLARELNAGYLVQGSVRQAGDQLRINVQLIDTGSGAYIWAERFDVAFSGSPGTCEEITGRLVRVLSTKLTEHAGRMIDTIPPQEWTSCDLVMRGRALLSGPISKARRHAALKCFEQALALDAGSIGARSGIAGVLVGNIGDGWSQSVEHDLAYAEQLLLDVLSDNADIPDCHGHLGLVRRLQCRLSDSMIELETGIRLHPNNILANMHLAWTLIHIGRPDTAIIQFERCLRLAPHDRLTPIIYSGIALSRLLMCHFDEAIFYSRKARALNPQFYYPHLYLAAALPRRGELGEAEAALRQSIEIRPEIALPSGFIPERQVSPQFFALYDGAICPGLRQAGLPAIWADAHKRLAG